MSISTIILRPQLGRWARLAVVAGLGWLLQPAPAQAQCNQLVWADEFDTPGNLSKWQVYDGDGCETGLCNFGNAELQVYRAANATVAGGNLSIATRYENSVQSGRTYNYTSAKLLSKTASGGLQTFRYGRIEARMQLPSAQGVWPAFWMLADPGNWPYTGEIDIMEAKHKNPKAAAGTIHYDAGGWNFTTREYISPMDLSQGFHVYAIEWSPDQIKWFVDGTLFHTASPKTTKGNSWPFNDGNFYLILNTAVGGPGTGFTGLGLSPTPADYPVTTLVDYVRVYGGTYNYALLGADQVHQGDQNKTYRLDGISGATYSWTVPAGASIVGGQGTNAVQVNWSGSATSGTVTAAVAVLGCPTGTYSKAVTVTPALLPDRVYEDFEANRVVSYDAATGTLMQAVNNPSASINTSAKVGQYVRNASEKYDVLNVRNLPISNANDYVAGRRKMFVDVYSTAPAGSKVTMQFENSQVTTAINFPYGRHSAFRATTTRQNAWETLEFEFEKGLDAGTSIYSIDNVAFLFQPNVNSGATFYFDNLQSKKQPEVPIVATDALLNYDGAARLTFDAAGTNGAYTPDLANPSATGVNTSPRVAKYVRNATEQYDVLFLDAGVPGTVIEDATLFKNQTYQLQVDVYTSAPVGTPVNITLQNKTAAAPVGSFPAGRNSTYLANTTRQNQWETLTFAFNSAPDPGTANVAIDQLAVLFNSGLRSGDTYYIDNIRVAKRPTPTYAAGTTFENYDAVRNLPLRTANGTYVAAAPNPAAAGGNTSAAVGKYTRNTASQYDALALSSTQIKDGAAYVAGRKVFALDVYTSAPVGTLVTWQLESSTASTPGNFPSGRHSVYQAVVKQTNAWHQLTFSYAGAPDPGTVDADVDNVVLLFAPNSTNGSVFYIDNLRSLTAGMVAVNAPPSVSLTSPAAGATFTAPASITINASAADSDGSISKVEFFQGTTPLGNSTSSPYSFSWSNVAAGTYSLTAKATDNSGAVTTSAAVSVTVNGVNPTTQTVPGTIQGESYTAMQGVETEATTDAGGGRNVSYFDTSDWVEYDVNVQTAGSYTVGFRVASAMGGATLQLRNSAGTSLGSVNVGNTGGWQSWQTISATVSLPVGVQKLRVHALASTGCNLNYLTFSSGAPVAQAIPGTIQGESYSAMQGILTEPTTDAGGGRNVNDFQTNDWVEYDVNVQTAGSYTVGFRVASANGGATLQLRNAAGTPLGSVNVGNTGSWQSWITASATVTLPAGVQKLRVHALASTGCNLNYLTFAAAGTTGTACTGTVANGDYSYEVSTTNGAVSWKFVPLAPIAGSSLALLYVKVGAGGYAGYSMAAAGSSFTFSQTQANGAALSFYFTYRVGTTGTERNSSATPHSYTAGATCAGARTALSTTRATRATFQLYPNPAGNQLTVSTATAEVGAALTITDGLGRTVREQVVPKGQRVVEVYLAGLPGGFYQLTLRSGQQTETQKFIKQ